MPKFEQVDVLDSLEKIMLTNTEYYRSDFQYDKEILRAAARKQSADDRTYLWMSRPSGTWCLRERDTYLKDSREHNTWKFYGEQTRDKILAYVVEVTGITDGKVIGNLYPLDYQEHFRHVKECAISGDTSEMHYLLQTERQKRGRMKPGNMEQHIAALEERAHKSSIRSQPRQKAPQQQKKVAAKQKNNDLEV